MSARTKKNSSVTTAIGPVTFDLPEELFARLERSRVSAGLRTTSEIVRAVIDAFDFEACTPHVQGAHRQISVRLSPDQHAVLKRTALRKKTSIGELLRLAIETVPAPKGNGGLRGSASQTAKAPKKKVAGAAKEKAASPPKAPSAKSRAKR